MSDGLSAVYSFYDPDLHRRSLGTYVVTWLVKDACLQGLPYVYLGYWIAESRKMAYKSRFSPLEAFGPNGWRLMTETTAPHTDDQGANGAGQDLH